MAGRLSTTPVPPCRCSPVDAGGDAGDAGDGGGGAGKGSGSASATRWRLEEGGSEAHSALNVVLVSPQIPGNAGSIARTCAAAGVRLHLVEPMGFQLDDAKLKRAGLDYWPYVCVAVHASWATFMDYYHTQPSPKRLIGYSKKATTLYTDVKYRESDWLLFGSETQGFPEAAVGAISREGALVRIPMSERHVRSLNLSVSVGIGLFESLRQLEAQQTLHPSSQLPQDPVPGVLAGQGVTMRTQ